MTITVMKNTHSIFSLSILAILTPWAQGANIVWGVPEAVTAAASISNPPGSTIHIAADFNNDAGTAVGDDNIINGIPFVQTPTAGSGNLVTNMVNGPAYGTDFFTGTTDDGDLDGLLDSHSYTGANPGEVTISLNNLTPGFTYQVQLIGVADGRSCCAGRTYEPDDGAGNYTTGIAMNRGGFLSVIGTFDADATSQLIMWRSLGAGGANSDPGFSGLVVLALPNDEDSDSDGLSDAWETLYGLNPNDDDSDDDLILDGNEDEDLDGLTNLQEQAANTNPGKDDTDEDGYLDGVETGTGIWAGANNTGTKPLVQDSDGDSLLDGVENPDLPFIDENQTGSDPNKSDTDSDSLPDNVEVAIGSNPNDNDSDDDGTLDGDEDFDSDGSSNFAELQNGTDIADNDSDDDTLLDGVETNTGIWVSIAATGTNPLNADSDNDGLFDGVENPDLPYLDANQPGSNPNIWDTDGDLRNDAFEITNNTNPADPASFSALPAISFRPGLIGGDLTDPEDDGIDTEDTAGTNFNWVSIASSSKSFFTDATVGVSNEGAFDVFDNKVGGGEAKWCCDDAPQDLTVEFADPVSITHFTMTSSNDTPGRDPLDWEIQGSDDGITFTPIYSSIGAAIWTARNQTAVFVLDNPSIAYKFIRYSVTATSDPLHALGEIEYFGLVGGNPLEVTEINHNEATNQITLSWSSNPGRTYSIFSSFDLLSFVNEVADEVPAAGDGASTTTLTFPNPNIGSLKQFFQVVEE
jgi:hypothetical protein